MIFDLETTAARDAKNSAWVEKMRSDFSAQRERLRPQWEAECQWHPWFALLPVDVGSYEKPQIAWLHRVERRIEYRDEMPIIKASWSLRTFEFRLR